MGAPGEASRDGRAVSAGTLCALLAAFAVWVELRPCPSIPNRGLTGSRLGLRLRRTPRRREQGRDLASVVTEVASRLRAGAPVQEAWRRSLERTGHQEAGTATGRPLGLFLATATKGRKPDLNHSAQVAAVEAACRLADALGAPLADVLDRCGQGLAEAARADSARRVALAGPASTARLLAWLPVAGVLVGWGLGADPFRALLDGRVGTAAGLVGGGLIVLGRRWTAALVAAAKGGQDATPVTGRFR